MINIKHCKKKIFRSFLLPLILFAHIPMVFTSCVQHEDFPDEPLIEFEGFVKIDDGLGYDNRGVIVFRYQDGDGDIGLESGDTIAPFDYNLFLSYFEKQNGVFKEVVLTYYNNELGRIDTVNMNARIPVLTPDAANKSIEGSIYDTVFINNYSSPYDTIRFEIFIRDRALNESNTITTPEIIINK